jgi:Leucine-rich repeat (LRR) protein
MVKNLTSTDPPAPMKKSRRRWLQFSLRSLLVFTLLCAVGSAWVARRMEQKRKERETVEAIVKSGGQVYYDYQVDPRGVVLRGTVSAAPPGPGWLRGLFGENFFSEIKTVSLKGGDAELESIKGLTELQMLDLKQSAVTDAGLIYLEGFPHLESLCLGLGSEGTNIGDAGLQHVKGLSQLRYLYLNNTKVTDVGLANFKGLTQLQTLYLDHTLVTDAGLVNLKGLTQLRALNLFETKITDVGLANIKGLIQLQNLWLGETMVGDAGLTDIKGLTGLENLCLGNTNVTDAGLENLKELNKLQTLDLRKTAVTDDGLANLEGLTQLQLIYLHDTNVSDTGLKHLTGLAQLGMLFVGNTKVTDVGVKELQKALPACQISR